MPNFASVISSLINVYQITKMSCNTAAVLLVTKFRFTLRSTVECAETSFVADNWCTNYTGNNTIL